MAKSQPCGRCREDVTFSDKGMFCEGLCELWYHIGCVRISDSYYEELKIDAETEWRCPSCAKEPFLTICRDIKYLKAVIFSISAKASFCTLETISKDLKAFICGIALKNENLLEDEICNKLGVTALEDNIYHDKMNTFQNIDYGSIVKENYCEESDTFTSKNQLESSHECIVTDNFTKVQDIETHYKKQSDLLEKVPLNLLETMCNSFIISSTPDVYESKEPHSPSKEMDSSHAIRDTSSKTLELSKVMMETSQEEIKDAEDVETSASKEFIPNLNLQSNAEKTEVNNQQSTNDGQRLPHSGADLNLPAVENVPTIESKSDPQQASIGEGYFEVENILDHMRVQNKTLFLVKWKNYGNEHNSWESNEDLTSCKLAISRYFRRSLTNYENMMKESVDKSLTKE